MRLILPFPRRTPDSVLHFFDKQARGLAELGDASHFHDRGFLLPPLIRPISESLNLIRQ